MQRRWVSHTEVCKRRVRAKKGNAYQGGKGDTETCILLDACFFFFIAWVLLWFFRKVRGTSQTILKIRLKNVDISLKLSTLWSNMASKRFYYGAWLYEIRRARILLISRMGRPWRTQKKCISALVTFHSGVSYGYQVESTRNPPCFHKCSSFFFWACTPNFRNPHPRSRTPRHAHFVLMNFECSVLASLLRFIYVPPEPTDSVEHSRTSSSPSMGRPCIDLKQSQTPRRPVYWFNSHAVYAWEIILGRQIERERLSDVEMREEKKKISLAARRFGFFLTRYIWQQTRLREQVCMYRVQQLRRLLLLQVPEGRQTRLVLPVAVLIKRKDGACLTLTLFLLRFLWLEMTAAFRPKLMPSRYGLVSCFGVNDRDVGRFQECGRYSYVRVNKGSKYNSSVVERHRTLWYRKGEFAPFSGCPFLAVHVEGWKHFIHCLDTLKTGNTLGAVLKICTITSETKQSYKLTSSRENPPVYKLTSVNGDHTAGNGR